MLLAFTVAFSEKLIYDPFFGELILEAWWVSLDSGRLLLSFWKSEMWGQLWIVGS